MKVFSLPLNPKLSQSQFNDYLEFVDRYRDFIYDIYFTSRIAPFNQDAMGDVFVIHDEGARSSIEAALHIQNTLGIKISATFNNISVPSDQRHLDMFVKNFRPLYEAGVRSATLPHTQWLLTGRIQAEFPDLFIKNTILRDVNRANQVFELAKAGFHYVNLDRDLMRDRDELLKIQRVKEQYPNLKVSLLANEGCAGNCPIMPEHYQYNLERKGSDPQYFNSSIARISCQKWDVEDPAIMLKTANLPPWRADWVELLDLGIDTFKMHGRESIDKLSESMRIIMRFAAGDDIVSDNFDEYISDTNLVDRPIDAWRKLIKNCKFDCWDCHYCDKIYQKKSGESASDKVLAVVNAIAFHDNAVMDATDIPGLTSQRVRKLLFELGKISTKYLEVGSYLGATGTAVMDANIQQAYFVDMWKENIQPAAGGVLPGNDKQQFIANIKKHKKSTQVALYESDLFDVDTNEMSGIDLFFYDGPHDEYTTAKAVKYYSTCLSDEAVIVFDDANFDGVVDGARKGLKEARLTVVFDKVLLGPLESSTNWWNGLYIVVVKK